MYSCFLIIRRSSQCILFLLIERKRAFLDVGQGSDYASVLLKKVYMFYRYSDCSEYMDFQSFKRFMEMEQKVCF